jgi:hypothetical protein
MLPTGNAACDFVFTYEESQGMHIADTFVSFWYIHDFVTQSITHVTPCFVGNAGDVYNCVPWQQTKYFLDEKILAS